MRMPMERLPRFIADALKGVDAESLQEIRVRINQPVEIGCHGGFRLLTGKVSQEQMTQLIAALTGNSVYACESQLKDGFFTLPGGARVGVAGRYANADGALQSISSVSIRIPRSIEGDSGKVFGFLSVNGGIKSCLILSPPRMGKTTLLRALIEKSSEAGFHVAVADERDELSGGESLGALVDVVANCPKNVAIARLIRSMSPDVIATDEIGRQGDSAAIADAKRSGCAVFATAHAVGFREAARRDSLRRLVVGDVFDFFIEMGRRAGHVTRILDSKGDDVWTDGL